MGPIASAGLVSGAGSATRPTVPTQRHAADDRSALTVAVPDTQATRAPRALLVEPDQSASDAMRSELIGRGFSDVSVVASSDRAVGHEPPPTPDSIAIVSLRLGDAAIALIQALRAHGWPRVLALFAGGDPSTAITAVGAGATGVIATQRGGAPGHDDLAARARELSDREIAVIHMVADGRTNKYIGAQLGLSALTVKSHLARIGRKLGTGDRAHIVMRALHAGVVS